MSIAISKSFVSIVLAVAAVGCGQTVVAPLSRATTDNSLKPNAKSEVLLSEKPTDAKSVAEVRQSANDGSDVTIVGRIGGSTAPWVEGRAAFTVVDPKLEPCKPGEGCPTPWDYCCSTDQLPANLALIKVVDGSGNTVEQDARKMLGLKELQTVVVRGTAKRDEAGNLTVLASGVFIVPDTK